MDDNFSKGQLERQQRFRDSRKRFWKRVVVWFIVIGLLGVGVYGLILYSRYAKAHRPGVAIAELERTHIPVDSPRPEYNSNPPTSGPHYEAPANWGVYDKPLPDEQLVHNLEHGGIWISYRDPNDQTLIDQLKGIAEDYTLKVIMTPRVENDSAIVVAAWGRLLKLDIFDEAEIRKFIKTFINRGPEQTPM